MILVAKQSPISLHPSRHDYALQTAVNRLQPLAGKSTLGHLEQLADRETVVQAHRLLRERFHRPA